VPNETGGIACSHRYLRGGLLYTYARRRLLNHRAATFLTLLAWPEMRAEQKEIPGAARTT